MSALVVDASVIAKIALPEEGSAVAERVLSNASPLLAPDLIFSECANAFWKHVRRRGLDAHAADALIKDLMDVPLIPLPLRSLTALAFRLATQYRHPVYDCYYLAAAIRHDCPLVTADRRLAALATDVGLRDRVIVIGGEAS